jgi:hypothetical protein
LVKKPEGILGVKITSKIHSNFEIFVQCMKKSQLVIDTFLHLPKI